jgi:ABC-2 type transport system permease protein
MSAVGAPREPARPGGLTKQPTPIKGPTALGSDPARLLRLTTILATTDFKLRFFGSVLGYLWQLMRPLMLFGVLYVVFSEFLNFGSEVRYYPVALLMGIVMFGFLSEATSLSVRSLVVRESLVRKIEFPRLAVPLSTVLTAIFNLGLNLVPVFIFLLAAGGRPRWSWLELIPLLAGLAMFVLGLAMLLSVMFVRYRDVEPIWDVVLQILFYATPIFYTVQLVQEKSGETVARLLMCNPFAAVLQQARHAVIDPSHTSAFDALGGYPLILVPPAIVAFVFVLGYWIFSREAPRVAERL